MHERYDYRSIRIERAAWPRVIRAVHSSTAEAVRNAGGTLFGLWRGEIGWYTDEGVVITAWPAGTEPVHDATDGIAGVVSSTVERIEATVRPIEVEPPESGGVYAHRWFEIAPGDWDEFAGLSQAAWPDFESAHDGTRVIGLWRSLDDPSRVLLLTRYASLAMWELSRPYNPTPAPGTQDARERFMRRAELTRRTVVRLGRLLPPPEGA
jgi:hypothetical protein